MPNYQDNSQSKKEGNKKKNQKKVNELDKKLKDTFPASDPTAKY